MFNHFYVIDRNVYLANSNKCVISFNEDNNTFVINADFAEFLVNTDFTNVKKLFNLLPFVTEQQQITIVTNLCQVHSSLWNLESYIVHF